MSFSPSVRSPQAHAAGVRRETCWLLGPPKKNEVLGKRGRDCVGLPAVASWLDWLGPSEVEELASLAAPCKKKRKDKGDQPDVLKIRCLLPLEIKKGQNLDLSFSERSSQGPRFYGHPGARLLNPGRAAGVALPSLRVAFRGLRDQQRARREPGGTCAATRPKGTERQRPFTKTSLVVDGWMGGWVDGWMGGWVFCCLKCISADAHHWKHLLD